MLQSYKEVLHHATQEAGSMIKKRFAGSFEISHKEGINNLVTEVDKQVEQLIIAIIKKHFPQHGIICEESEDQNLESEYKWIIDPIDGTVNFAHAIPLCCVSVALQYQDELLLGAVFNPMMDEYFFAEKGKGAFLNGNPIAVSKQNDLRQACLVTGFPYQWPNSKVHPLRVFETLVLQGIPIRRLGSAALDLCWVACGRFDGFWEYNLQPWDIAAGYLIVQEAGGTVSTFDGSSGSLYSKETLATNGHIHEAMMRTIGSLG